MLFTAEQLSAKYTELENKRSATLERARKYSAWTLPYIAIPEGLTDQTELSVAQDSIGAELVSSLASVITNALFLPNKPFFKLDIDQEGRQQLADDNVPLSTMQLQLTQAENQAMRAAEQLGLRPIMQQAIKALIITGNSLIYKDEVSHKLRRYTLEDYVVQRDPMGKPMIIITQDKTIVKSLSQDMLTALPDELKDNPDTEVTIYTGAQWDFETRKYIVYQAVNDIPVEYTATYTETDLPWLPLYWELVANEDYGRGLVEDYAGDFEAIAELSNRLMDHVAASTFLLMLVDPTSTTNPSDVTNASQGDVIAGNANDITVLSTANKLADLQYVDSIFERKIRRLAAVFMLSSATTRDAERVTAVEIRQQADELERNLGGIYSSLSTTVQRPLAKMILKDINVSVGENTGLEVVIVAGVDALARYTEHNNIVGFLQELQTIQIIPAIGADAYINVDAVIRKLAAGRNILDSGIMYTEEETAMINQQKQQAQQQEQMTAAVTGAQSNE